MKQQLALLAMMVASGSMILSTPQAPAKPTHTLIFHETQAEFNRRTGDDAPKYWADWSRYIDSVRATGKVVGGSALLPPQADHTLGRSLSGQPNRVSGFLTVSASSDAEAIGMAKGSPAIRNGGTVEVRPHLPMMENEVSQ